MRKSKNTWFNEYQTVEDHIISLLGDKFIKIKLVEGIASDVTIQMINELVKPIEEKEKELTEFSSLLKEAIKEIQKLKYEYRDSGHCVKFLDKLDKILL